MTNNFKFISWSCDCSSIFSFVNQKLRFPTIHLQVQTCCSFWYPAIPNYINGGITNPYINARKYICNWGGLTQLPSPNSTKLQHLMTCNILDFAPGKQSPSHRRFGHPGKHDRISRQTWGRVAQGPGSSNDVCFKTPHRIHGTNGIFTYINGLSLWFSCK